MGRGRCGICVGAGGRGEGGSYEYREDVEEVVREKDGLWESVDRRNVGGLRVWPRIFRIADPNRKFVWRPRE